MTRIDDGAKAGAPAGLKEAVGFANNQDPNMCRAQDQEQEQEGGPT